MNLLVDHHINRAIVLGRRRRGVEVFEARDIGAERAPDSTLLDLATARGCLLLTEDRDFLEETERRQARYERFSSVILSHPTLGIGLVIRDVEFLLIAGLPSDHVGQLFRLPL